MDASQIVLTAEGRKKLMDELAWREGEKSREIVEHIKERAHSATFPRTLSTTPPRKSRPRTPLVSPRSRLSSQTPRMPRAASSV